jgi:hypothetical protein
MVFAPSDSQNGIIAMLKKLFATALCTAALLVAGCGGGGSSTPSQSNLTKETVLSLLLSGVKNSSNIRTADSGETRSPLHARQVRDGEEDKYFDEWLGLWVKQQPGLIDNPELGGGELYFEDEALTVAAGHRLTWISDPGIYPIVGKEELLYTAGNFAGERDLYEWSVNEDSSGSSKGEGTYVGVGSFKFQGSWNEMGISQFTERFTFIDGTWQDFTIKENDDLSYRLTITSSLGVKFILDFKDDQSGTGRIEGPATGLPATLVWDIDGNGTLTWSDGSTTTINIYDL